MIRARTRILRQVFHDFTSFYVMSVDDSFPDLYFFGLDEAQEVLDRLVVSYVKQWPVDAQRELGIALGAALLGSAERLGDI